MRRLCPNPLQPPPSPPLLLNNCASLGCSKKYQSTHFEMQNPGINWDLFILEYPNLRPPTHLFCRDIAKRRKWFFFEKKYFLHICMVFDAESVGPSHFVQNWIKLYLWVFAYNDVSNLWWIQMGTDIAKRRKWRYLKTRALFEENQLISW